MKEKKADNMRITCLFLMLLIYPINNLLINYLPIYYPGLPNNITIYLYIVVFIYFLFSLFIVGIKKKDVLYLIIIYLFYFLMYLKSNYYSKLEFETNSMKLIYFYFIPASIFMISHIKDWNLFFRNKKILFVSDFIVIITTITKLFLNDNTDYMIFSYAMLPFWTFILVSGISINNKKQLLFVPIILFDSFVFGSRGALLWLLICGVSLYSYELFKSFNDQKKVVKKIFFLPLIIGLGLIIATVFLPQIIKSQSFNSSYIVRRINMGGNLLESEARIDIMEICFEKLKNMGFSIYGLFYDRSFLPKGRYSHSIIIETLLSFGWIIGTAFLYFLVRIIIKSFNKNEDINKIASIYFVCSLFLRYFVSGSAYGEGNFIIFLASIISLCRCRKMINYKDIIN